MLKRLVVLLGVLTATSAHAQQVVLKTSLPLSQVLATPMVDGRITIDLPSGTRITIPVADLHIDLSRALEAARANQTTAAAQTTPADATAIIARNCETQWKTNFQMQAFCRKQQQEAVATLAQRPMSSPNEQTIRKQCVTQWAENFQMQNFCEEQQLKALKELGR
jgi:hypothetical protein